MGRRVNSVPSLLVTSTTTAAEVYSFFRPPCALLCSAFFSLCTQLTESPEDVALMLQLLLSLGVAWPSGLGLIQVLHPAAIRICSR